MSRWNLTNRGLFVVTVVGCGLAWLGLRLFAYVLITVGKWLGVA